MFNIAFVFFEFCNMYMYLNFVMNDLPPRYLDYLHPMLYVILFYCSKYLIEGDYELANAMLALVGFMLSNDIIHMMNPLIITFTVVQTFLDMCVGYGEEQSLYLRVMFILVFVIWNK